MEVMKHLTLLPFVVVCALVLLCVPASAVTPDYRITPGEGIGPVKLGMNPGQVHEAVNVWKAKPMVTGTSGGPAGWRDEKAGCVIEGYQAIPMGQGRFGATIKVFYVDNKVAQIGVDSALFATNKDATVRLNSVAFGRLHTSLRMLPVQPSWNGNVRAYYSTNKGVAVTYTSLGGRRESMSAQEIFVFKPGEKPIIQSPRASQDAKKASPPTKPTLTPAGNQ